MSEFGKEFGLNLAYETAHFEWWNAIGRVILPKAGNKRSAAVMAEGQVGLGVKCNHLAKRSGGVGVVFRGAITN